MSVITLARPLRRARRAVGRLSLAGQFMLASLAIFVAGLFGVGFWVADQIEQGVVHRTAATTALYMDSFVAPHLQTLATQPALTADDTAELATLPRDTALGRQVAAFKV